MPYKDLVLATQTLKTGFSWSSIVAAEQAAEKLKMAPFRGMPFAEESLILLTLKPGEIPRFARNDAKKKFFRSL